MRNNIKRLFIGSAILRKFTQKDIAPALQRITIQAELNIDPSQNCSQNIGKGVVAYANTPIYRKDHAAAPRLHHKFKS